MGARVVGSGAGRADPAHLLDHRLRGRPPRASGVEPRSPPLGGASSDALALRHRPRRRAVRRHRPRAGAPEHHDPADRQRELHLAGGAAGHRLGAHQQVLRGLSGQALLRRQPVHRRGRGPGPRAGQAAVRRRARQRAAPLRRQRQHGRVPRPAAAGRHRDGPQPRPRRPPHPRLAGQRQRQPLPLRVLQAHPATSASTSTRCATSPSSTGPR